MFELRTPLMRGRASAMVALFRRIGPAGILGSPPLRSPGLPARRPQAAPSSRSLRRSCRGWTLRGTCAPDGGFEGGAEDWALDDRGQWSIDDVYVDPYKKR
jgi:hypothetical protein